MSSTPTTREHWIVGNCEGYGLIDEIDLQDFYRGLDLAGCGLALFGLLVVFVWSAL